MSIHHCTLDARSSSRTCLYAHVRIDESNDIAIETIVSCGRVVPFYAVPGGLADPYGLRYEFS